MPVMVHGSRWRSRRPGAVPARRSVAARACWSPLVYWRRVPSSLFVSGYHQECPMQMRSILAKLEYDCGALMPLRARKPAKNW